MIRRADSHRRPGETETVHAERALVLAPHFDDEVLGCGGLIAQLVAAGCQVTVLFLTDSGAVGEGAIDDAAVGGAAVEGAGEAYSAQRRSEAQAAVEVLGLSGFDELTWPDGKLALRLEPLAEALSIALVQQQPDLVLVPSPCEVSPDHRAAFWALHRVLTGVRAGHELASIGDRLVVLTYEINHPQHPNLLVDVSPQVDLIERAMACYASQQERHDYLAARQGLTRFRTLTLPPGTAAVEAYRRLRLIDFTTRGPTRLWQELAGEGTSMSGDPAIVEGPTISVVVRTKDRPELLTEALLSLEASSYRRLQIVLVNDGGQPPELPAGLSLETTRVDLPSNQGRAAAANAGVEASHGDYIAFLDDDDLVEPEHFATLANLVSAAGVRVAYSDAAVGVYELDGDEGWKAVERRLPYSRDFDADLLLVDNYIPFNTLLIERQLFAEAGSFDAELPFFEDWDFLIRLAALTPFHHLPRVTCEYRQFRGGGHHILGDQPRQRADFLERKAQVLDRHRQRLDAHRLSRVVDLLRAEAVSAQEESKRWQSSSEQAERLHHQTRGELQASRDHALALEEVDKRARDSAQRLRQERTELQAQVHGLQTQVRELHAFQEQQGKDLQQAYDQLARLDELIKGMESTRAWRVHRFIQERKG